MNEDSISRRLAAASSFDESCVVSYFRRISLDDPWPIILCGTEEEEHALTGDFFSICFSIDWIIVSLSNYLNTLLLIE